jgi:uncharacterized protein YjbJ (UPF0337 family)
MLFSWQRIVDKEQVKGAADKGKGAAKDAFGKMTDDKEMQVEGKVDKARGAARDALGDAKDAARRAERQPKRWASQEGKAASGAAFPFRREARKA